jgi:hypothetical protein
MDWFKFFCFVCLIGSFSLHGLDKILHLQIQKMVESNPFQLSIKEYTYLAEVIKERAPCNVLVFGLGNDSALWHQVNASGKTVFLEHNSQWYEKILSDHPYLICHFVQYHTKLRDWKILLNYDPTALTIDLPSEVMEIGWDLIFVDAPEGYEETKPGRMQSIYMASLLAQKGHAHVLVHDCDRPAEQAYCSRFLGDQHFIRSIEKLRHYKFESK